jgi:hypothetical protein
MSLIRRKKRDDAVVASPFVPLREAAQILRLDESTIRQRKAGTESLTLVRQGTGPRARIFLLRSQLDEHVAALISQSEALYEKPLKLVRRA